MNLTKVSKFLSLVLRHKPEEIGIRINEHGWTDVLELVENMTQRYPGFTLFDLEEIVRTDEKQRYSFSEDRTLIRANQGHSIPVDLELEPIEPPEYLWHGTGMKYKESIEEMGLIPKSRRYVHLSGDVGTATDVGKRHGELCMYRVSSGEMHRQGFIFYRSVNGVWLTERVPVEYLLLCMDD